MRDQSSKNINILMSHSKIEQKRITLVAGLILIISAAIVGTMVFYIMKNHAEDLLRTSLQASLQSHVTLAQSEIRQSFEKSATVATRPFLISQISDVNTKKDDEDARTALRQGVESFLITGLNAIALYDLQGQKIVQAGNFVTAPDLDVPIHFAQNTQLIYKGKYYLRATINIVDDGRIIGKVVTENPLPALTNMFESTLPRRGATSDFALCAKATQNKMKCFPTTLYRHTLTINFNSGAGAPLPMSYALNGKTGFVITRDYRDQEVVAAYSPVDSLGLGMVLKMDSGELYAPVWHQLRYLIPLMILMLSAALLALRWLLAPLINQLVRSEKETREANERLKDSESHVRLLLDNADEGIISIAADGTIELFNPAAERIFQYPSADVLGKNISMLMPEPNAGEHTRYIERYLKGGDSHVIGTVREVDALRGNGDVFPIELRVSEFSLHGQCKFIGIMHDITERKAAEAKIIHLAHYDALTDLPNRRLVQDRIQNTIARVRRSQTPFAVMFIDLNRFKEINDTLGHDAGDQLLKVVAQRLSASLRAEDTVGRQGGDEFIVLLANLSAPHDSAFVAQKIIDVLSEPIEIHGQIVQPSASIGIAVYPQDGDDVDSLLKHSDQAMYLAKDSGSGVYRFYGQAPNAQSHTE
jgi:diguanylate cyclase (GGDEF)-like protein/PAS domain S-box-containing protein